MTPAAVSQLLGWFPSTLVQPQMGDMWLQAELMMDHGAHFIDRYNAPKTVTQKKNQVEKCWACFSSINY